MTSSINWKYITYITYGDAARGLPSHGHGIICTKMMKIGRVVTDNRQTHKQTDTLIAILHVPPLLAAE